MPETLKQEYNINLVKRLIDLESHEQEIIINMIRIFEQSKNKQKADNKRIRCKFLNNNCT